MRVLPVILIICFICFLLGGCSFMPDNSYTETQFLLDTVCTIEAGGENAESAVKSAFDEIGKIQKQVDFYDENSTVSLFNKAEANTEITLDNHTALILKTCLEVSYASQGAFDVTVASLTEIWDFKEKRIPTQKEIEVALKNVGYENLVLDEAKGTLLKKHKDIKIDLGGAAKGYCADIAADILKEHGAEYGLINLGGNIVAFGKNPKRKDGSWQIGIKKPFSDGETYEKTVSVENYGAVVTSGTYERYFYDKEKLYHHIIEPKTGYPADNGVSSVTIMNESALLADCLSTACLVSGKEKGRELANEFNADIYIQ